MVDYDKLSTLLCFINDSDASSQYHRRVVEYEFIIHVFFNSILGCPRDFFFLSFFLSFFFFLRPLLFYILTPLLSSSNYKTLKPSLWDFPGGPVVKNLPASAGMQAQSLAWEDSMSCRASKRLCYNHWSPHTWESTHHHKRRLHKEQPTPTTGE